LDKDSEIVAEFIYCPTCETNISNRKIIYDYELGEQICPFCGTVVGEQRNNDFFTQESFLDIYHSISDITMVEDRCSYMMGHESKIYGTRGSGLSGVGGNIITSFTETMDFSSIGIMSSIIDKKNVDYMGVKLKDPKYHTRLRYTNSIITCANNKNPNEKNTKQVVMLIKQISQKKNFPPFIQERVVNLYREISEKNKNKRLQYKITAYWCLYYVLREHDLTPSLPEFLNWIVEMGFIEEGRKTIIQKKINKVQIFILDLMNMSPIPHSDYIYNVTFLCNKHGLDEIIKRQCLELGNIINVNGGSMVYQGRSPKTIAAMLIAIIMTKEGLKDECKELLKDLKITNMILRKILQEVIQTIEKNNNRKTEDVERLKGLLSLL
jgi:transcription initiation factor TFIIIB Brf1 subunit/transcription initiation factor TFIIB